MYLNPIESSARWAQKYEMYSPNWYYHQARHSLEVRKWRKTNTLTLVK